MPSGSRPHRASSFGSNSGDTARRQAASKNQIVLHADAHEEGGLSCNNDELLKQQREAITEWIKSMGKRLMTGSINLISTPFPVVMFEPRSYLEKLADVWVYPQYLKLAATTSDPLERMKWTVTWFVAGLHHGFEKWKKPFNPILGETWQACLVDGSAIAMEQISHHPPVSAFRLDGPSGLYSFVGLSQPSVTLQLKNYGFKTVAKGFRYVQFADGTRIEMQYPSYCLKGVVYATRPHAEVEGKAIFIDAKHKLKAVLTFGPIKGAKSALLKRTDAISGKVFKCSNGELYTPVVPYELPPQAASVASSHEDEDSEEEFASASENEFDPDEDVLATAVQAASAATATAAAAACSPQVAGVSGRVDNRGDASARIVSSAAQPVTSAATATPARGLSKAAVPLPPLAPPPPQPVAALQLARKSAGAGSSLFGGFGKMKEMLGINGAAPEEECAGVVLAAMEGSWLSHFDIESERLWTLVEEEPCLWQPIPDALPSDSRFRMDLAVLKSGDIKGAQQWKEQLENEQRADKKLRGHH